MLLLVVGYNVPGDNIAPWQVRLAGGQLTGRGRGAGRQIESHTDNLTWTNLSAPTSTIDEKIAVEAVFYRNIIDLSRHWPLLTVCGVLGDAQDDGIVISRYINNIYNTYC